MKAKVNILAKPHPYIFFMKLHESHYVAQREKLQVYPIFRFKPCLYEI